LVSISEAFQRAVDLHGGLFDDVPPGDPDGHSIEMRVPYPSADGALCVDTGLGPIQLPAIRFQGRLIVYYDKIPLWTVKEYRRDPSGRIISQVAEFPVSLKSGQFAFEVHDLVEAGDLCVLLR